MLQLLKRIEVRVPSGSLRVIVGTPASHEQRGRDCRLENERWAVPALETFLSPVHAHTQPHCREEHLNVMGEKMPQT